MTVQLVSRGIAVHVLRPGPEVLLLRRTTSSAGAWCQVAGGVEPGETGWQAGLRELREETGLVPERYYSADILERFYEVARDEITVLPVFVAMVGSDAEVTLNHEHDAFEWLSFPDAIEKVAFSGQRRVLEHVEAEFVHRTPNEWLRIAI